METEPVRSVDVMIARAKRIYTLSINVNKLFSKLWWRADFTPAVLHFPLDIRKRGSGLILDILL